MTMLLRNSVFVHVPRTGGMWVRQLCRSLGIVVMESSDDYWNHCCYSDLPVALRSMPSFAFVRHPIAWVRSRWAHSLAIDARAGKRFKGIHGEFDRLVRPTLADTVRNVLRRRPGLVGATFRAATSGVDHLRRTRDLPMAAVELLHRLEGVPKDKSMTTVEFTPPCNGVEGSERLPPCLERDFIQSEGEAMTIWEGAA